MELYKYLMPTPRTIRKRKDTEMTKLRFHGTRIDKTMQAQEYKLVTLDERVEILGGSKVAVFYAEQTLAQLWELYEGQALPDLFIHDWPEIARRGYYYDVTRGKVPTLKTLKMLADRLAHYKINELQLYVEHTFAFAGFEEMWEHASPLTAKEIKSLDRYCAKKHIELVPSLSTFGHLYELLRTEKYRHLCELEGQADVPFNWPDRMLHHTIDVSNPESMEVINNLLDQFIPLFQTDKFNICCDETFDLGRGKNAQAAKKVGKGRLYVDFLKKIIMHVQSHGKTVMFWGDILLEHPEYIAEIPKDTILLNWDYATNPNEGKISKISESGLRQYLCPGVWGWNNLVNDIHSGYENISKMAQFAVKYKAIGLLNTDWGDFGNVNALATSIPGMIMGAAFSWNTSKIPAFETACKMISRLEYGDLSETLVAQLDQTSRFDGQNLNVWTNLAHYDYEQLIGERHTWYNGQLFEMPVEKVLIEANKIEKQAVALQETMHAAKKMDREDIDEITVAVAGHAMLLRLLAHKLGAVAVKKQKQDWFKAFSKVWRQRNKKSELYRIKAFLDRL